MKSIFLLFLFLILFSNCNATDSPKKELVFRHKFFIIKENVKNEPSELPAMFYYKNAKIIKTGLFKIKKYNHASEGIIIYETMDNSDKIEKHYIRTIRKNGWNIIQSKKSQHEKLLMTESPGIRFRQLITIIIRDNNPSKIKIYFRGTEG